MRCRRTTLASRGGSKFSTPRSSSRTWAGATRDAFYQRVRVDSAAGARGPVSDIAPQHCHDPAEPAHRAGPPSYLLDWAETESANQQAGAVLDGPPSVLMPSSGGRLAMEAAVGVGVNACSRPDPWRSIPESSSTH